jgi:hypothetical protein
MLSPWARGALIAVCAAGQDAPAPAAATPAGGSISSPESVADMRPGLLRARQ